MVAVIQFESCFKTLAGASAVLKKTSSTLVYLGWP
ncbi:hypothetical protein HNR48_002209 [Pseudoteredinibacter isoporae]|uniref:Uncharacterized protein n=1 Tax=Pseudoteredinibacter isoporae TaxID=570281 RepID=A0A7X0JU84_9GAMM|nr:hypothetical protein [Pseudoteredinibacter isoporae]